MTSRNNCSVYGCFNTYSNTIYRQKPVHFYAFPSRPWMKERRSAWIRFVKRNSIDGKPWLPTKNSKICSDHFANGEKSEDPRSPSYNPSIRPYLNRESEKHSNLDRYQRLRVRENRRLQAQSSSSNSKLSLPTINELPPEEVQDLDNIIYNHIATQTDEPQCDTVLCRFLCEIDGSDVGTQMESSTVTKTSFADKDCGPNSKVAYFGGFASLSTTALRDLSSVSSNVFALLLSFFPNSTSRLHELKLEDKVLITLIKLKTGLPFCSIGGIFGVNPSTVSRVFTTIITHIYHCTKDWIIFPSQSAIRATLPSSFVESYSSCRVIIDCTEIRTETPPTVEQRIHMYSNYKGSFTAKYLVGITPNGLISFISKGYGGRATDTFITNDCGILDLIEPGDTVMADKGFPNIKIQDGVLLVMPPFANRNESQFSVTQMTETYKVASVRIHVERAIQRLKNFQLLSTKVTVDMLPKLDMILHVCSVLSNLGPPIIKESL